MKDNNAFNVDLRSLDHGNYVETLTIDVALDRLCPSYYLDRNLARLHLRDGQPLRTMAFEYRRTERTVKLKERPYQPQDENWKLLPPTVSLTSREREWFDWAVTGAEDVLQDDSWLEDNEDALTIEGQIADMRYRLEEQSYSMTPDGGVNGWTKRTLDNINDKLETSGYWKKEFHTT